MCRAYALDPARAAGIADDYLGWCFREAVRVAGAEAEASATARGKPSEQHAAADQLTEMVRAAGVSL